VRTAKSAVKDLLRISWRTVGRIVTRVSADAQAKVDRFAGLRRIGIDEISYKRGHRYLTVVVDHVSGRIVWAAVGRDEKTLRTFFDKLGEERLIPAEHPIRRIKPVVEAVLADLEPLRAAAPIPRFLARRSPPPVPAVRQPKTVGGNGLFSLRRPSTHPRTGQESQETEPPGFIGSGTGRVTINVCLPPCLFPQST
jgi:hypothetical protein